MAKKVRRQKAQDAGWLLNKDNRNILLCILAVEIGILLLVAYKGLLLYYLPVTILLMLFTAAGCGITFYYRADRFVLIFVLLLLNLGFMVQQIELGKQMGILSFLLRFVFAIGTTLVVAFAYRWAASLLAKDLWIWLMILVQYGLCILTIVLGKVVGQGGEQSAQITLFGITPFEIVKVVYIFIAAGLLCEEKSWIRVGLLKVNREILLVIHTVFLTGCFLICRELGTLMIVYITGLVFLWIYGKHRPAIIILVVLSVIGFVALMVVCEKFLCPQILDGTLDLPNILKKVVLRFGLALHPENEIEEYGYQGIRGLEAIAAGGLFGIGSERLRLNLPEASSDFAFADIIQTCGLVTGIVMILLFFCLLSKGFAIADQCKDLYFKGVAIGITVVIAAETLVHVGYNIALLPITGIPLYFVSSGFTAIVTGMALIAVLLVISTGRVSRKEEESEED